MKKLQVVFVIFIFILLESAVHLIAFNKNDNHSSEFYAPMTSIVSHTPISINGNGELTEFNGVKNWWAQGTEEDPFIIENYYITSSGEPGIYLRDITVYVVIQNCIISGNSIYGINIYNCINIIIQNNDIEDYSFGIRLYNSNNTKVELNYANNQANKGIIIEKCSYCLISKNEVENSWDSGISIENSRNCNITNNICHHNDYCGIELDCAFSCLIKGNTNYRQSSGILLMSTEGCTITENDCFHNEYYGIRFSLNNGINFIFNNTFSKNYWYGIYLYTNQNNEIFENDLSLNGRGPFYFSQSYSDNLYNNIFKQPNEMITKGLPNLDLEDNTRSFSEIFTLVTFDSGGAGQYQLSLKVSCQKEEPNNLTIRVDAYIDTMSGNFFQLTSATFIYDISLEYATKHYVAFSVKTDSTSTIESSSTIYNFPMCSQIISLNSQFKDFNISFSYILESTTWNPIEFTFSESMRIEFGNRSVGKFDFNLLFIILPLGGLVTVLTLKIRKYYKNKI